MNVLRWIFIAVTLLHLPINLFAVRDQFYTFLKFKRNTKNHTFITLFLTLTSFGIPIFYPNVIGLLGLIGGLCSTTICIIVPFMLAVRLNGKIFFSIFRG
jgi:amino acid permease